MDHVAYTMYALIVHYIGYQLDSTSHRNEPVVKTYICAIVDTMALAEDYIQAMRKSSHLTVHYTSITELRETMPHISSTWLLRDFLKKNPRIKASNGQLKDLAIVDIQMIPTYLEAQKDVQTPLQLQQQNAPSTTDAGSREEKKGEGSVVIPSTGGEKDPPIPETPAATGDGADTNINPPPLPSTAGYSGKSNIGRALFKLKSYFVVRSTYEFFKYTPGPGGDKAYTHPGR